MENINYYSDEENYNLKLNALITVPDDFDVKKEKLPVIVSLHGSAERGDNVEIVSHLGIPNYFVKDPNFRGLRVITVSPQCPQEMVWNHITYPLMNFIKKIVKQYNGDENRVSITGLSMGGYGTWDMIMTFPDYFSAAAPICGGGDWRASRIIIPVRVFHGDSDSEVDVNNSIMLVNRIKKYGGDVSLTIFKGVDHDSWTSAYLETDLIEWLISQKRKQF